LQAAVVPAIHGKWEVRDVPTPHPATNQVLIKIHASGLCYTDVHITEGLLPSASFPRTVGHEPVGEIVEVGDGVTKRKIGDRVGVPWFQSSCGRCEWCQQLRTKVDVIVKDDQVDQLVSELADRLGSELGGKIFVMDIPIAVDLRTKKTGEDAV
jgi:Zn-dependent alcohol dehydrogenase